MKIFKLLLVPLMMIGLTSCGSNNNETSNQDTSVKEQRWNYNEEALMKSVLNNNIIPYFDKPSGGTWVGVQLPNDGINKRYGIAYEINGAKSSYIMEMKNTLLELGYIDQTNIDAGDKHPKLIYKLADYDINEEKIVCEPQLNMKEDKFGALFYYQARQTKWNQREVDELILQFLGIKASIPEPEFSFTIFETATFNHPSSKTVGIALYTDDENSPLSYYQTLEKAGFSGFDIESKPGQKAYVDKDTKISVTAVYNQEVKCCVIGIIAA